MTKVLRIESSIKGPASVTRKLTDRILAKLAPTEVVERDTTGIALIDGTWIGAAYTPADQRNDDQKATLATSDALLNEIRAADVLVIAMPLYNFGITGPLKAWIDQICRVGESFQYSDAGPQGLLTGKRAIVAYASGGVPMNSGYDFASGYVRQVLGFIGITDVSFVAAEGVALGEEAAIAKAEDQIAALAA